jgi:hypothetical protein
MSESFSELSVVSDNICNNHEKNVAFDVVLIESNKVLHKRHASNKNAKDKPRADQKSLLIVFDGTGMIENF